MIDCELLDVQIELLTTLVRIEELPRSQVRHIVVVVRFITACTGCDRPRTLNGPAPLSW